MIIHAKLDAPGGDAIAITGDAISAVGDSAALGATCVGACKLVDVHGGFVMPGFHDAHAHPYNAGAATFQLAVHGAKLAPILDEVRAYAHAHPGDAWILGRGWVSGAMAMPTAADLDAIDATRPIALTDSTGHNLWVDSPALRAAAITSATPNPPGGIIVRAADGSPTGVLEDTASGLVIRHEPQPSAEAIDRAIAAGEAMLLGVGCTSYAESGTESLAVAREYARLDAAGQLHARVFLWAPLAAPERAFRTWLEFARGLPATGKVQVVAFKGFADGTMAVRTAALNAPYSDEPEVSGELRFSQDALAQLVIRANREGYPVAIHAIGDRAVHAALDAFEASAHELHHALVNRVEHVNVLDPSDAPRFAALHVAASVQPVWMYGFASRASFSYLRRLGDRAERTSYAWRTLHDAGATLLFGSDVPSSALYDPISGIFAAMHREFKNGETFTPEQALDGDTALRAYTSNAPAAFGWGRRLGRLEVGQLADVIWLERDPRGGARSIAEDPLRGMWIAGVQQ